MHEFLKKYGPYVIGGILLFALIYYMAIVRPQDKPKTGDQTKAFFVDENDLSYEEAHPNTEIPPITGKNGKQLVMAIKIGCQDGSNVKIAYLKKFTPEVQEKLKAMAPDDLNRSNVETEGEMLRDPSPGSQWVLASSDAAAQLRVVPDCPKDKKPMTAVYP